jgi:hypothetical protein
MSRYSTLSMQRSHILYAPSPPRSNAQKAFPSGSQRVQRQKAISSSGTPCVRIHPTHLSFSKPFSSRATYGTLFPSPPRPTSLPRPRSPLRSRIVSRNSSTTEIRPCSSSRHRENHHGTRSANRHAPGIVILERRAHTRSGMDGVTCEVGGECARIIGVLREKKEVPGRDLSR